MSKNNTIEIILIKVMPVIRHLDKNTSIPNSIKSLVKYDNKAVAPVNCEDI